jgi:hypothetical protein
MPHDKHTTNQQQQSHTRYLTSQEAAAAEGTSHRFSNPLTEPKRSPSSGQQQRQRLIQLIQTDATCQQDKDTTRQQQRSQTLAQPMPDSLIDSTRPLPSQKQYKLQLQPKKPANRSSTYRAKEVPVQCGQQQRHRLIQLACADAT